MKASAAAARSRRSIVRALTRRGPGIVATIAAFVLAPGVNAEPIAFTPGDLALSYSVYPGLANPNTGDTGGYSAPKITPGSTVLPINPNAPSPLTAPVVAVADGTYPKVFDNATVDANFGVASPIYLGQITTAGKTVSTTDLTALTGITTSFSSKSELALNLSTDGNALTFLGYNAPVASLDRSNSNTPGHIDPSNTSTVDPTNRSVVQINANGSLQVTNTNAHSGNNGRAGILAADVNGTGQSQYLLAGNAGNGGSPPPVTIVSNTGVQLATPGGSPETTVVGQQQGTPGAANGFQFGFSVAQNNPATGMPYGPADKSGKDNNFRGLTIFDNTLYVTKGSGGSGINTVYQVGTPGTLPTSGRAAATPTNILPGFPTFLANTKPANLPAAFPFGFFPFGIWFANPTTLYVGYEGDGVIDDAGKDPNAGLEKWSFDGTQWVLDYTLQAGLSLGVDYPVGAYFPTATDGLRNITGVLNADGTATIYGVTSTVSKSGDQGADPNEVVVVTDALAATALSANEIFSVLEAPQYGVVYRGVAFDPVPEPGTLILLGSALAGFGAIRRRRRGRPIIHQARGLRSASHCTGC
jgi:PEP-CTERM motif